MRWLIEWPTQKCHQFVSRDGRRNSQINVPCLRKDFDDLAIAFPPRNYNP